MAVKLTRSQLPILYEKLYPLFPENIRICGEIKCKLENRSKLLSGFEFVVDKWPDFTTVLWKPDQSNNRLKFIDNHHSVLTQDRNQLQQMLKQPDIISWNSPIVQFADVRDDLYDVIAEAADRKGYYSKLSNEYFPAYFERTELIPVPKGLTLKPLSVDHAEIVMRNVDYSGEGGVEYCRELIKHYPSLAVFDKGDNLAGYFVQTNYGIAGMFTVMPTFRSMDVGKMLLFHFAKIMEDNGQFPMGLVNRNNVAMYNLLKKCGLTLAPQTLIWIDCYRK